MHKAWSIWIVLLWSLSIGLGCNAKIGLGWSEESDFASYISYGPIKIFNGEYISTNDFMARADVTDKLIQWVEEEHQYFFKLHNGIADNNDPEFGFVKELQMKYAYHDEEINLKCMENQWVKLP